MVVADYELFVVPPRFQFLRLQTDDGAVGWGEPVLEGRPRSVRAAVHELMEQVVLGADPADIQRLWQRCYRGGFYRGGPILMSALAGIDQALWDLKGKRHGAPVFELLGGRARDRVQVYAHVPTPSDSSPPSSDEYAAGARDRVDAGFRVLKTSMDRPFERLEPPAAIEHVRERFAAIREAVGPEVGVAIDFHGRVPVSTARRLVTAIEPLDPLFIEEPVPPGNEEALPRITNATTVPIATGERLYSRWDVQPVLDTGVAVIQPDLSHAGGITEVQKIASMAEVADVALAPHCPLGPVALAACLQVDLCSPNAVLQEQVVHRPEDRHILDSLEDPTVLDIGPKGSFEPPTAPGLGVNLSVDTLRELDGEYSWQVPDLRHHDGGVAEW